MSVEALKEAIAAPVEDQGPLNAIREEINNLSRKRRAFRQNLLRFQRAHKF
jgi:Mn-dependent DtxR family transcriptional regulator